MTLKQGLKGWNIKFQATRLEFIIANINSIEKILKQVLIVYVSMALKKGYGKDNGRILDEEIQENERKIERVR